MSMEPAIRDESQRDLPQMTGMKSTQQVEQKRTPSPYC